MRLLPQQRQYIGSKYAEIKSKFGCFINVLILDY